MSIDLIPADCGGAVIAPPRRRRGQRQVPSQPWQAVGEVVGAVGGNVVEIEGYSDLEIIGRGGFAVVYKARQVSVGRDVAIKLLTDPAPDDDLVRRFTRESKAVGALSWHPHIAAVVDAGSTAAGQAYIVFEFLTGGSLDERIKTTPMPWADAVEAMIQVADAVEAAHRSGVLHRDIKPANILLDRLGVAKLGDFGIASMQDGHKTETGTLAATVAHAAPELFGGVVAGRATDVYALGSTLHTLLVGTSPFRPQSNEMMTVISRILHDPPPAIDSRHVPEQVSAAVAHALAKQPTYRPRSAAAFGRSLQQAQRELGVTITTMPVSDDRSMPADYTAVEHAADKAAIVPAASADAEPPEVAAADQLPHPAPPAVQGAQSAHVLEIAPQTEHVPFAPLEAEARSAAERKPLSRTIGVLSAIAILLAAGVVALLLSGGQRQSLRATTGGGARIASVQALPVTEMAAPNDGPAAIDQNDETYWGITMADDGTEVKNTSYVIQFVEEQTISRVGISNGMSTDWAWVTGVTWSTGIDDTGQTGRQISQVIPNEPGAHTIAFDITTTQLVLVLSSPHGDGPSAGVAEILIEVAEGTP